MIFLKYKVIALNKVFAAFVLIMVAIASMVTISHISTTVSTEARRLPIYSVETEEKKIAITFDAAWSAEDTDELLDILNKHNAKITVYAVGDWVDKNPDAVKKFYEACHEIGNHSDTHPSFSKLSKEEIRKEIVSCNEKIKAVTGEAPKTARAPSGDYDNKSIEVTESLDMKMIQWDVDSLDWKENATPQSICERVTKRVKNGSIVLFHNDADHTPEALPTILKCLKDDGYEFVFISDLILKENYEIKHDGTQCKIENQ